IFVLTLLVIGAVAFAMLNEGLLAAICSVFNVLLAGLVAFGLYEPMAEALGDLLRGTAFEKMEDAVSLAILFAASYAGLRFATEALARQELDLPARFQQVASGGVGAVAGYLLSGFLVVMVSTLPLSERFLGYEPTLENLESPLRRYVPADRVWLGLMHHLGHPAILGSGGEGSTFDPEGTFVLRYAKKRRLPEQAVP
ncbi:MAG: CvpA family protein, partial [Gemmataceae bacterium]